ncbi:MAG TPA: SCO family protein [Xanthobacteraceae bacterium]|nr:SCO family protein [Xanthobacteraceae bacterium]
MRAQGSRAILLVSAFLLGLALFGTAIVLVAQRDSVPVLQSASIGGPFQLVDQNGKSVTERDLKGKPFLVFFGYTHCPDVCPTTLFDMTELYRRLGPDADKVAALFVTVDPERDTKALLKDYMSNFDPHIRGLTGSQQAIEAVEKEYHVYARKIPTPGGGYTMDHTALVYLMDKEGRFVAPFDIKRPPEQAAADLRKYF